MCLFIFNDNESMYTSQLKDFVSNDIFYWRNKTFSGLWNALCKSQKVLYELIFLHKRFLYGRPSVDISEKYLFLCIT